MFTPSTKAEIGDHDENISFERAVEIVGQETAERARDISLELYLRGSAWAAERGIIIADTKFELGFVDGALVVCDEVLDARLVTVLARRRVEARSHAAELRQATLA